MQKMEIGHKVFVNDMQKNSQIEFDDLRSKMDGLQRVKLEVEQRNIKLLTDIDTLERQLEYIQSGNKELELNLSQLNSSLQNKEQINQTLANKLDTTEKRSSSQTSHITELEKENDKSLVSLVLISTENERLTTILHENTLKLEETQRQNSSQTSQLQVMIQKNESLELENAT